MGSSKRVDPEYRRIIIKGVIKLSILLAFMFLAAGRLNYWQGWVFSGITFVHVFVAAVMFSDTPDLAKERVKPGPGTKWWDKVFWAFFGASSLATFVVAPLDVGRFGWTSSLPTAVYVIAYLVYVLSVAIGMWAMRVNRFFSSVVRIQTDRGQVVVESGPYKFVRHPGYVGGVLTFVSLPLVLGSVVGLIPGGVSVICLIARTYLEDITLREELQGYEDYATKVVYRLLPGIW
jgi:protein-S-isoprenylcysteine O-methyltransferase Ste14